MEWLDSVVESFGRGLNVENLSFGDSGIIHFDFENYGTLCLERQENGVLIHMCQEVTKFDCLAKITKALKLCHYTELSTHNLQAGLKDDDQLFLLMYLNHEDFNQSNLEECMEFLIRKFEQVE